ncbi:MAG: GWxTD domain-containing protein [candidate division Zixibacteria bacterium]|nr:GWxTD domain-containing protein [candidate division Zixibacteria bacterium]
MRKCFYPLLVLALVLIIAGCTAKDAFSPKKLRPEERRQYELLKKAGAGKEELDRYVVYCITGASDITKNTMWMQFWEKKLKSLSDEEQAVFHALPTDSSGRLEYLSLKDERSRRRFVGKLKDARRQEILKNEDGGIFFYSLRLLASDAEMTTYLLLPDSLRDEWLRIWWKRKDPNLTTEVNELRDEFGRRVRYALANFHDPTGQKPWDDRGDVYILYGEPDAVEPADYYSDRKGNFDQLSSFGKKSLTAMDQRMEDMRSRSVVWSYFRYGDFQFQDYHATDYWELAPHKRYTSSRESQEDNLNALMEFMQTRTVKVDNAKAKIEIDLGEPLDFAWDAWKFWSEGDSYDLRVNLAVPLRKLGSLCDSLNAELDRFSFQQEVVVLDARSMRNILRDSAIVRPQLPKDANRENLYVVEQFIWNSIPPGTYVLGVCLKDSVTQKIGIDDTTVVLVPHVDVAAGEKISRIVLADSIWVADSAYMAKYGNKFVRNSLVIVPHPHRTYLEGQSPPTYYCEIYGLESRNDTASAMIVHRLLSRSARGEFSLYAQADTGYAVWPAESQPFLKGSLNLPKGDYILHILVYDLNDTKATGTEIREAAVGFEVS